MSTVKKFLKSEMGLRFYGFSKLGIWVFCVIQVCARRRPGANADVMSCWEGKFARDLKRQCMQAFVVSISAKIPILFYQSYAWKLPVGSI